MIRAFLGFKMYDYIQYSGAKDPKVHNAHNLCKFVREISKNAEILKSLTEDPRAPDGTLSLSKFALFWFHFQDQDYNPKGPDF